MNSHGVFAATNSKFDIQYLVENAAQQLNEHYEKLQTLDQSKPYTLITKEPNEWHVFKHYLITGDNISLLKYSLDSLGVQNHSPSSDSLIIYARDLDQLTYQDAHHCLHQIHEALSEVEGNFFTLDTSPKNAL